MSWLTTVASRVFEIMAGLSLALVSFSVLGHLLENVPTPGEVRPMLVLLCTSSLLMFLLQRRESKSYRFTGKKAYFYVLFTSGALLLDMSLDGTTSAHNVLSNVGTAFLITAVLGMFVDRLIQQDNENESELLKLVTTQQTQLNRLEAKIDRFDQQLASEQVSSKILN